MIKTKDKLVSIISIALIIILFVISSYIVQANIIKLKDFISNYLILGALIYIFLSIIAIVIAPISALPLIPIASGIYGWVLAGIFSIVGWFIGAMIAFWLARSYGKDLIKKLISIKDLEEVEILIPKENLFLSLLFLRMVLPVDGFSYAVGLFTKIKMKDYAWITLLGIAPFAFVFAYLGVLPILFQVIGFLIGMIFLIIGLRIALKKQKKMIKAKRFKK